MHKFVTMSIYISLVGVLFVGCGADKRAENVACATATVNFVNKVSISVEDIDEYNGLEDYINTGFIEPTLTKFEACLDGSNETVPLPNPASCQRLETLVKRDPFGAAQILKGPLGVQCGLDSRPGRLFDDKDARESATPEQRHLACTDYWILNTRGGSGGGLQIAAKVAMYCFE
jgi:hypothetical protein